MTVNRSKLPFSVVSSSVTTGYNANLNTNFKSGSDITGHHQDTYGGFENEPLQSPFTKQYVGGEQHRHTQINLGQDNDFTRAEAFKIKPENGQLKIYGPDFENVNKPRAQTWKGAKSPLNISNIQNSGNLAGNFNKNYEIFQTVGRGITNNLIVDNFIASGVLTTQFITGAHNYSLPNIVNNSDSIIVGRFNAPGGKNETSRGTLDRIGEELSPNNSLTTRNITARQAFYSQLTQHSPQFGSGLTSNLLPKTGSINTVSIHKVNRNNFKRLALSGDTVITTNEYDNFWVQYAIPRSDFGYAWITASTISNPYTIGSASLLFDFTSSLNKYSVDINTQTLLGATTGSGYYSSWKQIRTGEHPVARKQKDTNIIAIEKQSVASISSMLGSQINSKRTGISINYKETPVSNKSHPIIQEVQFEDDPDGTWSKIKYSYSNLSSRFANEDIDTRLGLTDKKVEFYEKLVSAKNLKENSPIKQILSLSFKESIFPKEANTYLSGTRNRTEYILNQPGFDRNGYDRQLGTQRVFWRDEQGDRQRSNNNNGGYINSLGYSSLNETGSDFTQNDVGILYDNSFITLSGTFKQNASNLASGINNSIILLETSSSEKELYTYTGSFLGTYYNNGNVANKIYANIVKRSVTKNIAGEFDNSFIDFYEQFVKNNQKQSIGAIYRNSSYKEMNNSLPKPRENLIDFMTKTDDEQVFVNPKPRYISFVGGGELNTSSFFDNNNNFSNEVFNTYISGANNSVNSILNVNNKIYFGGSFTVIGGIAADYIAVYDKITQKFSPLGGGTNGAVYSIAVSGSDIYIGGVFTVATDSTTKTVNRIAKWSTVTNTWSTLSGGVSNSVSAIAVSGTDIYVGGAFTGATDSTLKIVNRIAKWSTLTNTWSALSGGLGSNIVNTIAVSGSDIYVGGDFTTTGSRIAKWSTVTNTWSALSGGLGTTSQTIYNIAVSGSDIYVGGNFTTTGSYIAKWSTLTNTWSALSGGVNSIINTIAVSGTDIYVGGFFTSASDSTTKTVNRIAKWSTQTNTWSALSAGLNSTVNTIAVSDSGIYVGGAFTTTGSRIAQWLRINNTWSLLNSSANYNNFNINLFNNVFNNSDVKFSSLDNGLQNNILKKPWYDSSEEYYKSDIYQIAKDFSILSEFKMSEHIKDYIVTGTNFQQTNNSFLSLDGASTYWKSSNLKNSTFINDFFEKYCFTDILNKNKIENDYLNELSQETININISGIKKLSPYNGFYPKDRTIQIANLYSDYIDNILSGGIFNLNNVNEYYNDRILSGNFLGPSSSYGDLNSSINVEKYLDKYFLIQNTTGMSYLYSSSASGYKSFSQDILYFYNNHSGSKLISASNGLNIYSFSVSASFSSSYNHLSTNGTTWSGPVLAIPPISASDGFGEYWDYVYQNNSNLGEKIFFCVSSPFCSVDSKTSAGVVSFVSATMTQYANNTKNWEYSNKIILGTGSASNNQFGTGVSILSCSSGFQVFMGELYGDVSSPNYGNIWVATSSNGANWSTPISILNGTNPSSSIGFNNIKAVNFNYNGEDRSYVFFTEPLSSGSSNVVGKFFVISSSANNNWGTINIDSQKTELYAAEISTTISGTLFDITGSNKYSIEAYSGNGFLTYCFVNGIENSEQYSEILIGSTYDGLNWQKNDQMFRQINGQVRGCDVVGLSTYERNGYNFPVFFTNISSSAGINSIYAITNNQFTQFSLNISGTEKYVKQAALEPIMAPGILYNTIKSGIAVDWPCATGSQTSIQLYGSGTIANAYYPQSFKMASYAGQNINELNMYGNLKSNIDYRVNFEKLIFPDDIFTIKSPLTSSLTKQTTRDSLEQTDELVQFISGCYIYGGYEPYTSPADFSDFNQLGPKRFSIPFVYRKQNETDNGLYSMAMSNFLAETVKFFLKDGLLTSFQSNPDSQWEVFESGKKYYMDIVISKTSNLVMMEAYHDSNHPIGKNGEKMNGRYFGYPVNKTNKKLWSADSDSLFTNEEASLIHNDPAYAPYTPPYFEGTAIARVSFSPAITRKYTIDEVFSALEIEDIFPGISNGAHTGSDAYLNKMPVESSLNIKSKLPSVLKTVGEQNTSTPDITANSWVIATKFETPVLDFSSQSLTPFENNYIKSSGYGRGMWSGYGEILKDNQGIYVSIQESFPQKVNAKKSTIQSLLQKVGFTQNSQKIGIIADKKTIKEAIMIIPFVKTINLSNKRKYNSGKLTQIEKDLGIEFIGIRKKIYDRVVQQNLESSILDTHNKMKEFIVPPQFDYVKFSTIDPFVAYIAEFSHDLTQQDLADIWQGVAPEICNKAEAQQVTLSHKNDENEFFHGEGIPNEDVRFLTFKIKQKGEFNYFKVTKNSTEDKQFSFEQKIGRSIDDYSYNWPYDFYSLVELAKIDLQIDYKKKK